MAECYVWMWDCECAIVMANGDTAVATSSRYIFRESYSGNSQHSTNLSAPGTSSYIDGGMGISGDVEALYLRYSKLLLDTIIHNLLGDILFFGFIDVGCDWGNVCNTVRFSLLYNDDDDLHPFQSS